MIPLFWTELIITLKTEKFAPHKKNPSGLADFNSE